LRSLREVTMLDPVPVSKNILRSHCMPSLIMWLFSLVEIYFFVIYKVSLLLYDDSMLNFHIRHVWQGRYYVLDWPTVAFVRYYLFIYSNSHDMTVPSCLVWSVCTGMVGLKQLNALWYTISKIVLKIWSAMLSNWESSSSMIVSVTMMKVQLTIWNQSHQESDRLALKIIIALWWFLKKRTHFVLVCKFKLYLSSNLIFFQDGTDYWKFGIYVLTSDLLVN
jgi:hypothetical protein